jgi:hypothetical protein
MTINIPKLDQELHAAGVRMVGVSGIWFVTPAEPGLIADDVRIDFAPDATQTDYDNAAAIKAAHDPATPYQTYTNAFNANRRTIAKAFYTFNEGFRNASSSPTLAEYRTVLDNTVNVLATLPASFTTELGHERTALGLTTAPLSMTLAQCQALHGALGHWLGRAMAGVALAAVGEID